MSDTDLNRSLWDERVGLHGQDDYYDVAGFLAGGSSLTERELDEVRAAVGDVEGLDVLHLQCHFGLDTLSFARLGARATGLDFSPVAVERARGLAAEAGIDAAFVEADSQHLPSDVEGGFDLVFASYGVLCWIADVDAWMRSASAALRSGGHLVLIDLHPASQMVGGIDPLEFDFPYLGAEPQRFEASGSYAAPDAEPAANVSVEYAHGLGEIVTAAVGAGFRIDALTEWLDETFDPRGGILTAENDGRFRLRLGGGHPLPLTFSLRATKT
ncbi:MAG TPA: class I SAM-dependent methyltransferase [Actinomycetota bacterium]|nr:class I SAM-dependent methyltransferase [Actinomycetota bacterium]